MFISRISKEKVIIQVLLKYHFPIDKRLNHIKPTNLLLLSVAKWLMSVARLWY